jgi:hypothetical protein
MLNHSRQEHAKDLEWINTQVQIIQTQELYWEVIIATHHCPTKDLRATASIYKDSSINSAFVSYLSSELCWTAPAVKLWFFGYTYYNCTSRDDKIRKLLLSNQQDYYAIVGDRKNLVRLNLL